MAHSKKLASTMLAMLAVCACEAPEPRAPDTLVAVRQQDDPVPYGAVARVALPLSAKEQPAEWEFLKTRSNCRVPRPSHHAAKYFAYSYGGGDHTPAQYVEGEDARKIAAIRAVRENADPKSFEAAAMVNEASTFMTSNAIEWTDRVDVLVTETEKPVYLYLSSYNSILWNIQLAPGARIDGIVVSAYEGGIIANGVTPSRTAILSQKNSGGQGCFEQGATPPAFLRGHLSGYVETHGLGGFSAMLAGPVPETPFEPQPITRLQISDIAHPFWGTRKAAFEAFGAR